MKIAVLGPGSLGTLLAAYLAESGLPTTLVDHRPERAQWLMEHGVVIEGCRGAHRVRVPVVAAASAVGAVDLVIVCVKAYQTRAAVAEHRALVGPSTVVWSIQNGLGNVEAMAEVVPRERLVGGSTTMGANRKGPGHIHHAGEGETLIGELQGGRSERVETVARVLSAAGIPVKVSTEIQRIIWQKLLINVGINALTGILGVRNGVLVEHAPTQELMARAVAEAVRVAGEQGLLFDEAQVQARVREVAQRTGQNRSSMLQDILAGRPTEVEYINGAISRLGDAPVNATLTRLILALEAIARTDEP
jgi:2-dehydropantoate 2-reductase